MNVVNKSWIVRMRCTVEKEVIVSGCSEESARVDPFAFSESERELGQSDYEVTSVKPNE